MLNLNRDVDKKWHKEKKEQFNASFQHTHMNTSMQNQEDNDFFKAGNESTRSFSDLECDLLQYGDCEVDAIYGAFP